ncbi:hypothetical protein IQ243_08800 [Nostocales cyanobacterium LEGE 11386]|nr:hypothetical protein [Nostocales cyanobacterium LEGE 11386]
MALLPIPHHTQLSFTGLVYQSSEEQILLNNTTKNRNLIAQLQSQCNYLRQAFKSAGINISSEDTLVKLVSGQKIMVRDPNGLYTRLSGYQRPSRIDSNQNLPDGAFWVRLNEQALAEPNTQNISLKSDDKLIAQQRNYFAIYLKARGHICRFWIGLSGIRREIY